MDFQLVVLRGRSATTALKLGDGVTTAGRHDDCQLRIKSSEVSRRHCQFFEKNGMLLVKDLGSSNGTFHNGKKIEGQRVLEAGDELTIGPVKLRVEKVGQPAAAAKAVASSRRPQAGRHRCADSRPSPPARPRMSSRSTSTTISMAAPEEKTVAVKPDAKPPAPSTAKPAVAELPTTDEPIADDAIADFLLDLKLDDEE